MLTRFPKAAGERQEGIKRVVYSPLNHPDESSADSSNSGDRKSREKENFSNGLVFRSCFAQRLCAGRCGREEGLEALFFFFFLCFSLRLWRPFTSRAFAFITTECIRCGACDIVLTVLFFPLGAA